MTFRRNLLAANGIEYTAILDLNPRNRRQTKKYRPVVPIARQGRWLFDDASGFIVKTGSVRKGFYTMAQELGLPGDRESGMKLIRRSMADIIRSRLVDAGRSEDELSVFLGHRKINSVSELYAPFLATAMSCKYLNLK